VGSLGATLDFHHGLVPFDTASDELHHQYALGFTPQVLDGKMHTLTVRIAQTGATVRARKSYVAAKAQ
jgi:hypothetical protein